MPDHTQSSDPNGSSDTKEPKDSTGPKMGGFGAFAEVYRARWAANHPHAGEAQPDGGASEPSAPAPATPAGSTAEYAPGHLHPAPRVPAKPRRRYR